MRARARTRKTAVKALDMVECMVNYSFYKLHPKNRKHACMHIYIYILSRLSLYFPGII